MTTVELVIEADPDESTCATVMVDATVSGVSYRFIVDTGAGTTTLVADELTRVLPAAGQLTSSGLFATITEVRATVSDFRLGELPTLGVDVLVTGQHQDGARNLLGMNVLGGYRCRFRFRDRLLGLELSTTTTPAADDDETLMIGPHGQPFVSLTWPDGTTARALWDSGAGITVVDSAFHDEHPQLFEAVGNAATTDSTGTQIGHPTCRVAATRAGGLTLAAHVAAVIDLTPTNTVDGPRTDLVLGYPALSQANWVLDFPARRWSVSTISAAQPVND